jgi:PKD repeat protein
MVEQVPVQFTSLSTGNPTTYLWDFGDGSPVNNSVQNPLHTYSKGLWTVNLTISAPGVSDKTKTEMYYVNVTDHHVYNTSWVANITSNTGAIAEWESLYVKFNASWTGNPPVTYDWHFAGGSHSSSAEPVVTFPTPGIFWVNLTLTNAGGSQTYNATYAVRGKPPAFWTTPMTAVPVSGSQFSPVNVTFEVYENWNLGSVSDTFDWTFGDGQVGSGTDWNISHVYGAGGNYTVTSTMTNVWGSTSHSETYEVKVVPPQSAALVKWTGSTGLVITSAYINVPVSFAFDTISNGFNPPYAYLVDWCYLNFYKKDISTGNWVLQPSGKQFYKVVPPLGTAFTSDTTPGTMGLGALNRWAGYSTFTFTEAQTYRAVVTGVNATNPVLYPTITYGTSDIVISANPMMASNVGAVAGDVGGLAMRLIGAVAVLGILIALPFFLMGRVFNLYITVVMAVIAIGLDYFLGLIDIWVIAACVIVAVLSMFFMRGGGGGAQPAEGGEMG